MELRGTGVNARRRLRLHRLRVPIEWEEEPFQWVRPRRFGVVRHFRGGPLAELRVEVELTPRANGGTTLDYHVRVRPRNLVGLAAAPVQIGLLSRRRFARTFGEYDRLAREHRPPEAEHPARLAPGGRERLERGSAALCERGLDERLVKRLAWLLERGDELELHRLRPYELADAWSARRRDVLELLLHATRAGLTELRWDLMCPSCRGTAATAGSLGELEPAVHCEMCGIDVNADLDRSVEVTFAPSAAVRAVQRQDYCVGGPQLSPHVVAQQLLAPGEQRELAVALEPGSYRVRALGDTGGNAFSVGAVQDSRELTMRNGRERSGCCCSRGPSGANSPPLRRR